MMCINSYKIHYIIFIIVILIFGGIHLIGPVTGRHLALLYMVGLNHKEMGKLWHHRLFNIYMIFIFIFGITSFYYGYFDHFMHDVLAYYIPSYIVCWSTYILISKNNSIDSLITTLILIGIFNGFVTIGQYFNNPIAFSVPLLLEVSGHEGIIDILLNTLNTDTNNFSLYGIFGPVSNGYFSSVVSVLILAYLSKWNKSIVLIVWIFLLFSLFCVQQRTAFVVGVFGSLYLFVKQYDTLSTLNKICVLLIVLLSIIFILNTLDISQMFQDSRYKDFSLGSREQIYAQSIRYIETNLFTANYYHYASIFVMPPHNLFYNMLVYGTLLGAIPLIIVFLTLLKKAMTNVFTVINNCNTTLIALSISFVVYNLNSLTHNASIVTGDILFWLLSTPIMYYSEKTRCNHLN